MRGIIQLAVEVDYDKMITKDKLDVLHGYTGKSTEEDLRQHHLGQLCKSIVSTVDNLPFTKFDIQGSFVANENHQEEKVVTEDKEDKDSETVEYYVDKWKEIFETSRAEKAIELFDADIEKVSMELGMPTLIKVNETMSFALKGKNDVLMDSETENGSFTSYHGFPVAIEGMEELYIIEYKEYTSNEVKQHHRTAEELN